MIEWDCRQHRQSKVRISIMTDEHQVSSIIATAICDASKGNAERTDPEQAKQLAKCIIEALTDTGLQIVPANVIAKG